MAAKKRIKKQSLLEFRAWLEGVEELQPDNWAPNANQWKLIRSKIDGIKEKIVEKSAEQPVINNTYRQLQPEQRPTMMPPPPVAGGVPAGDVDMAPTTKQMFNPDGGRAKTPNIDSSDGNVDSPFA